LSVGLCAEERRHCHHPEMHRLLDEPELPKIDETCLSIEGANVYLAGANPRRSAGHARVPSDTAPRRRSACRAHPIWATPLRRPARMSRPTANPLPCVPRSRPRGPTPLRTRPAARRQLPALARAAGPALPPHPGRGGSSRSPTQVRDIAGYHVPSVASGHVRRSAATIGSYAATRPSHFCTSGAWVDLTLQHKNRGDVLVSGAAIVVRPVGARGAPRARSDR
jgi:hypothetical protein